MRMIFVKGGFSCAPEMYYNIIRLILKNCGGVQSIFDDAIVNLKSKKEHDTNFNRLFMKLSEKVSVNLDKCQFGLLHIFILGHDC